MENLRSCTKQSEKYQFLNYTMWKNNISQLKMIKNHTSWTKQCEKSNISQTLWNSSIPDLNYMKTVISDWNIMKKNSISQLNIMKKTSLNELMWKKQYSWAKHYEKNHPWTKQCEKSNTSDLNIMETKYLPRKQQQQQEILQEQHQLLLL